MSVFGGKHITVIGFNRKTDGFSYKADWSGKHEFGQSSSPIKVYEFGFTSFFELCVWWPPSHGWLMEWCRWHWIYHISPVIPFCLAPTCWSLPIHLRNPSKKNIWFHHFYCGFCKSLTTIVRLSIVWRFTTLPMWFLRHLESFILSSSNKYASVLTVIQNKNNLLLNFWPMLIIFFQLWIITQCWFLTLIIAA